MHLDAFFIDKVPHFAQLFFSFHNSLVFFELWILALRLLIPFFFVDVFQICCCDLLRTFHYECLLLVLDLPNCGPISIDALLFVELFM